MDCNDCSGTGRVIREACEVDGIQYSRVEVDCFFCNGTGELCDECGEAVDVCECEGN